MTNTFTYSYCDARSRFHKTMTIGFGHRVIRFGHDWWPWPKTLFLIVYHYTSIENTYCHKPLSMVTQFISIHDHFNISFIGHSLLLILVQVQYPLKVESLCNIVAWWIMKTNSLMSWFTIGPIQCIVTDPTYYVSTYIL